MKIALFSTYDEGGAGVAALRLNRGLNQIGEDSTLFVKKKTADNPSVVQIDPAEACRKTLTFMRRTFSQTPSGNTMCSLMYPGLGPGSWELLQTFQVFHLHWIPSLVSLADIIKMRTIAKPVIWTFHDQNPMTGACHYTHGCERYIDDCSNCPQLQMNPANITASILKAKVNLLPNDLVVVTPSRWLADCARKSAVFKNHRIEVIPYSLETDLYTPSDKDPAKRQLGVSPTAKVILFGATDLKERRKGLFELLEAIKYLQAHPSMKALLENNQLHIFLFGYSSPLTEGIQIPFHNFGYIQQPSMMSLVYSAADVLALPSLEDNLPNIMLESMACGTPVVAFATGGMRDVIVNGKNGFLVPLNNIKGFAARLVDCMERNTMDRYCRQAAVENYRLDLQAKKYCELYTEIVRSISKKESAR